MVIERDFPKLAINTTNIKPIEFLNRLQKSKFVTASTISSRIKPLSSLNFEINTAVTKAPSFFADPENITALRREHARTSKPNDRSAKLVSVGLHILDNMICLQNPSNLDPEYMNRLALAFFKQAARAKNALGMYLEGVAKIYGFCEPTNIATGLSKKQKDGLAQIEAAAERKCAEAQNFLGLLRAAQGNFAMCCRMFQDSAKGGHPQARRNLQKVMDFRQKLLAMSRKALKRKELLLRQRRRHRQREHEYESAHRNVLTY